MTTTQPWSTMLAEGVDTVQDNFLNLTRRTTTSRHYLTGVVWGNLQTADYARAMFRACETIFPVPGDIEAAVAKRVARGDLIGKDGREYHVVMRAPALKTRFAGMDDDVVRGQLTRLSEALDLPGLRLGIIPDRADLKTFPGTSFSILLDGRQVQIETHSAIHIISDPDEIGVYERAHAGLAESAVYGDEARALIDAELAAIA
ncbi:DUF5753 domain-containing protein [Streptomyces cavernicola]|uniref:DUF5753 domain-containing protein n=1 Tax=Streptomyces cavernicola TaxID=3043613 RepID=A0ABT6SN42_9ACTN|nr:DUF5753 domain-containing protein [Streptomyces sp. B-S-A6]MDI3408848.1 DUF5753 domain-containing protein [Streptomyces sp. B-S-A6]